MAEKHSVALVEKKKVQGTSENAANMAAMQFGRVDEYKDSKEDFKSYMERFEQWLLANDIPNEKKVSVFLSIVGADTYGLLKNLVTPTKSSEMQVHPAAACRSRRGCTWGGAARAAPPTMLLIG